MARITRKRELHWQKGRTANQRQDESDRDRTHKTSNISVHREWTDTAQHITARTRTMDQSETRRKGPNTKEQQDLSWQRGLTSHTTNTAIMSEREKEREEKRERERDRQRERWRLTGTVVSNKASRTFTLSSGRVTSPITTPTTEHIFSERERGMVGKWAGVDGWGR